MLGRFFAYLFSLVLGGCTSVPLASMAALSKVDFTTTQFSDLRVAVELQEQIRPLASGVTLEVAVKSPSADEKLSFKLEPISATREPAGLIAPAAPGRKIYSFKLREKDVAKLNATRERLMAKKSNGERGTLAIGVSAKEFCRTGPIDKRAFVASTFVATTETRGYVVVLKDYDLTQDKNVSTSIKNLPACEK